MEPITALGAAGSVVGIASLGLQLGQVLYRFVDEARSAKPSLLLIQDSIQSTTAALNRIHELLQKECDIIANKGTTLLFSPKALDDLKDTANKCLLVFWRIEGTITNQCGTSFEEGLALRLLEFNKQVLGNSQRAVVNIDITWTVWRSLRWPFITVKLQEYSKQLQGLQTSLTLMVSVISLGAQRSKQKTTDEDLLSILQIWTVIQRMAARGQLSGIAASISRPTIAEAPMFNAVGIVGQEHRAHERPAVDSHVTIEAGKRQMHSRYSVPKMYRSPSPLLRTNLSRESSPGRAHVTFRTHPDEEDWDPHQYFRARTVGTGQDNVLDTGKTAKQSLQVQNAGGANPDLSADQITYSLNRQKPASSLGHFSYKSNTPFTGSTTHQSEVKNILDSSESVQVMDVTEINEESNNAQKAADCKSAHSHNCDDLIELDYAGLDHAINTTTNPRDESKQTKNKASLSPETMLEASQVLGRNLNSTSISGSNIDRARVTKATSRARLSQPSNATVQQDPLGSSTRKDDYSVLDDTVSLEHMTCVAASSITYEVLTPTQDTEQSQQIFTSEDRELRPLTPPNESPLKAEEFHGTGGARNMEDKRTQASSTETLQRLFTNLPQSRPDIKDVESRGHLLKRLWHGRSPIRRKDDVDVSWSACIVKDGNLQILPHTSNLLLGKKQFRKINSQSSNQKWIKKYAFMKQTDREILEKMLWKDDGKSLTCHHSIVDIKKLHQHKWKFWARRTDAMLVLVVGEEDGIEYRQLCEKNSSNSDSDPEKRAKKDLTSHEAGNLPKQESSERRTEFSVPQGGPAQNRFVPGPTNAGEALSTSRTAPAIRPQGLPDVSSSALPMIGRSYGWLKDATHLANYHTGYYKTQDVTHSRLLDEGNCIKELTTYRVATVRPADSNDQSWATCIIDLHTFSALEISHRLKKLDRDKRGLSDKKAILTPEQQQQVAQLVDDMNVRENDPRFRWTLRQLDFIPVGRYRWKRHKIEAVIPYICRSPRPELNAQQLHWNIRSHMSGQSLGTAALPPPSPRPRPPEVSKLHPNSSSKATNTTRSIRLDKGSEKRARHYDSEDLSDWDSDSTSDSSDTSRRGSRRRHKGAAKRTHTVPTRKTNSFQRTGYYHPSESRSDYMDRAYRAGLHDAESEWADLQNLRRGQPVSSRQGMNPFLAQPMPRTESHYDRSGTMPFPPSTSENQMNSRTNANSDKYNGRSLQYNTLGEPQYNLETKQYPTYHDRERYDPGRQDSGMSEQNTRIVEQLLLEWTPGMETEQTNTTRDDQHQAANSEQPAGADEGDLIDLTNDDVRDMDFRDTKHGDMKTVHRHDATTPRGRALDRSRPPSTIGVSRRPTVEDASEEHINLTESYSTNLKAAELGPPSDPKEISSKVPKSDAVSTQDFSQPLVPQPQRESWLNLDRAQQLVEETYIDPPSTSTASMNDRPRSEYSRLSTQNLVGSIPALDAHAFHKRYGPYDDSADFGTTRSFSPRRIHRSHHRETKSNRDWNSEYGSPARSTWQQSSMANNAAAARAHMSDAQRVTQPQRILPRPIARRYTPQRFAEDRGENSGHLNV